MKQHLKTIEEMLDLLWEKAFYTITFDEYGVSFQGKFHSLIVKKCLEEGYKFEITTNGFVSLVKDQIKVILTE